MIKKNSNNFWVFISSNIPMWEEEERQIRKRKWKTCSSMELDSTESLVHFVCLSEFVCVLRKYFSLSIYLENHIFTKLRLRRDVGSRTTII